MEVWRDVVGFEGLYQVSTEGRIRSLDRWSKNRWGLYLRKGMLLSYRDEGSGYHQARLYDKHSKSHYLRVHRLVANAFIPNPYELPQINHIDEDRKNNKVDNLEWCDAYYNMQHSFAKIYLFKSPEGSKTKIFNLHRFCQQNDLTESNMHKVYNGLRNHHKGWTKW